MPVERGWRALHAEQDAGAGRRRGTRGTRPAIHVQLEAPWSPCPDDRRPGRIVHDRDGRRERGSPKAAECLGCPMRSRSRGNLLLVGRRAVFACPFATTLWGDSHVFHWPCGPMPPLILSGLRHQPLFQKWSGSSGRPLAGSSGSSGACRAPPSHAYDTGSEGSPTCIAARGACSAARSLQPSWSHVGLALSFCAHSFIQRLSRALCWLIPPPRPRAPVAPRARRPGSRCAVAAPGAGPAVRSPQRTAPRSTPARSGAAGRGFRAIGWRAPVVVRITASVVGQCSDQIAPQ